MLKHNTVFVYNEKNALIFKKLPHGINSGLAEVLLKNKAFGEQDLIKYANAIEEAVKALGKKKEVISVILYGSVARGVCVPGKSDIDLYVIVDDSFGKISLNAYKDIEATIGSLFNIPLQIEVQKLKIDEQDQSLLLKTGYDGIVLFNRGTIIASKNVIGLRPYNLIEFSTINCSKVERVKLSRKLNGYRQKIDGKIFEHKGLLDNKIIYGSGKGIIIVRYDKLDEFILLLREHDAKYRIVDMFYK